MKTMKLAVLSILAGTICFTQTAFADDDSNMNVAKNKKSVVYVGGLANYSLKSGRTGGQLGFGLDVLYMERFSGNFALGVNANASFGISRNVPTSWGSTEGPVFYNEKQTINNYNLSFLFGGISDHKNGSRLTYFAGPSFWVRTQKSFIKWSDYPSLGAPDAKWDSSKQGFGVTVGAYYQLPNSHWTVGLNGNTIIVGGGSGGNVALSVGYAF